MKNSKAEEKTKSSQKRRNPSTITDEKNSSKITNRTNSNSTLKTDNKTQIKSETERKSAINKTIKETETAVAENKSSEKVNSDTFNIDTNKKDISHLDKCPRCKRNFEKWEKKNK